MLKFQTEEKRNQYSMMVKIAVFLVVSMILADSTVASFQSPLNVALAGTLSPLYAAAVLVGSMITYIAAGKIYLAGIHIIALVAVFAARCFFHDKAKSSQQSGLITVVCMVFATIVSGIAIGYDIGITAAFLCISVLTGISTFFIAELIKDYKKNGAFSLNGTSGGALAVVYVMLILSLSSVNLFVFNIGRIIGAYVVLAAAKKYRYVGGAVCGILTSFGVVLSSEDLGTAAMFLAVAGLMTGFFSEFNNLVMAFFFISVNAVGQMILGLDENAFMMEADVIVGSILFVLIPITFLNNMFVRTDENEVHISNVMKSRFSFVTNSLMAVRRNAESITKVLNKCGIRNDMPTEVCERVCSKCRNRLECWDNHYEDTNDNFNKIAQKRNVSPVMVGGYLENCIKRQEIAEEFNVQLRQSYHQRFNDRKIKEMQELLFNQMEVTEQIMKTACRQVYEKINCDAFLTRQVCVALEKNGVDYESVIVYFTENEKLTTEIYFKNQKYSYDINEICDIISLELDKNMECCEPVHAGNDVKVVLTESPAYYVSCVCEKSNGIVENEPSGDTCEHFCDGYGNMYLVISDGMGSGKKAAIESKMVISHFKKLVRAGIECGLAIKMINSLMRTKSDDEIFATLDIAQINLETAKLRLIKSGASSTLVKHGENLFMINSPSFPIGIMSDPQPFEKEPDFSEGDVIIMLSDGVNESEYKYIKSVLANGKRNNVSTIANEICRHAQETAEDDVTVIAARLCRN